MNISFSNLKTFRWIYCIIGIYLTFSYFVVYPAGFSKGDKLLVLLSSLLFFWLVSKTFKFYIKDLNQINPVYLRGFFIILILVIILISHQLISSTAKIYSDDDISTIQDNLIKIEQLNKLEIYALISIFCLGFFINLIMSKNYSHILLLLVLLTFLTIIPFSKLIQVIWKTVAFVLSFG